MTPEKQAIWWPDQDHAQRSHLRRFMRHLETKQKISLPTFAALHEYSVTADSFWLELSQFLGIRYSRNPVVVLDNDATLEKANMYPPPQFFPGARLNYAENCLEGRRGDQIALFAMREGATQLHTYTFRELKSQVHALSDNLKAAGVGKGDVIAGVLCNSIHSLVIVLASTSLGALYSSTAPDMGVAGIIDRLRQVAPKIVFFDNASFYNSKVYSLEAKASAVLSALDTPALKQFVIVPNITEIVTVIDHHKVCSLQQFEAKHNTRTVALVYEQVAFSDPLFIMYSSGTTGQPKCIVHSTGGVLLQMRKEYSLHMNLSEGDVYWQYTTTGWMMYQYQITALAAGVSIVCLDGSPIMGMPALLTFMADNKVTHFGTSPRWLSELKAQGLEPQQLVNLDSLQCVTSTGSVLVPELYRFFYKVFPQHVQLASISGGTDLMSCFFLQNPISPVYVGQLQCLGLGMAAKVFDVQGQPIIEFGKPGELVCTRPFPSQPVHFLSDPGGTKYKSAYYTTFPGVWHHSDFVQFEDTGGVTMLGRSDGVLNPSGVRFGSAEIYSVTERIPAIEDSLCVGQRRAQDDDETVILFVKMKKGHSWTPSLVQMVKRTIKEALSARHVPKHVFEVHDIPMTINGKKVELVVKQIISGQNPTISQTIANPESLAVFRAYVDIEKITRGGSKSKL